MSKIVLREFTPLCLSIDQIGPFQARLETIDFTDKNNEGCNLYLLLSVNGRGKTTTLELMSTLMSMLGCKDADECAKENQRGTPFDMDGLDGGTGRAQWDVLVRYSDEGIERIVVLSLLGGRLSKDGLLKDWNQQRLDEVGAKSWHRFGFCHNGTGRWETIGDDDEWVQDWNALVRLSKGLPVGGFEEGNLALPTVIYFSAYRNIVPISPDQQRAIVTPRDWNYRPLHAFRTEGGDWRDSLDNLLVWLKWLDDGRFERALELVNQRVFINTDTVLKGISKEPPEAIVERDGIRHRLDGLSSGEKSLTQMFLRLGAHMTANTILLIDEPEAHLHENWRYRLFKQLKHLVRDSFPGLCVIVATHSEEVIRSFAMELREENLRKGGYLFETEAEERSGQQIKEQAEIDYGDI